MDENTLVEVDEECLLILMDELRDDILDRYNSEEYWDKEIISSTATDNKVSVEGLMDAFYEYWGRHNTKLHEGKS